MTKIRTKLLTMLIIVSFLIPYTSAYAAVYFTNFYSPNRDEYRFGYKAPEGTDMLRLEFISSSGTYYQSDYTGVTGIMYLTCNGTYNAKFFSGSTVLDETGSFVTNQIVSPTCQSYSDGGAKDDLNIRQVDNADGTTSLEWDTLPGATTFEIWKDGEKIAETTDTNYNTGTSGGAYTVSAIDGSGNIIGESDINVEPSGGSGTDPACDACKWLTDTLACPAWDEYMGELTGAIKNALPPPPDWPSIADVFVDKFSDYFGDVPVPPSVPQIESQIRPSIPPLDTSVPEASITPVVPDDFNDGPLDTDITSGPEIVIEDGSEPFEIYEPDEFINGDQPGQFVFPNDSRNSSDGIKQPDTVDTPYAMPVPNNAGETQPAADMPVPSGSVSAEPTPETSTGTIPIPTTMP